MRQRTPFDRIAGAVNKDLRLSGEEIMRTRMTSNIKQAIKTLCVGLGLWGLASVANAAPISGKVFLDYDNQGNNTTIPLSGLTVELLDSSGAPLATPQTTTTGSDGSYVLESPSLGSYHVKASTANNETTDISVSVSGASGITSQNVFLKGQGGDMTVSIKDNAGAGVKNIGVNIRAAGMSAFNLGTDTSGNVAIKNALTGLTYQATVTPSDIVDDTTNAKKYALWDATKADGSHDYIDTLSFTMNGSPQSGVFNVRERNDWGADGIVALDQDDDGVYTSNMDTPISGINVVLYYKGTTTEVLGVSSITTGSDGKYNFKNLPLGDYTVKLTNVVTPWVLVTSDLADFSIAVTTGNPSAFNFLLNVDPNDTSLASLSGYVFAVGNSETMAFGPDSGKAFSQAPTGSSTRLSLPIDLYQHNGTSWQKISSITSNAGTGLYSFKALEKNKDYKIKIASESSISTSYVFINDYDGKSPTRSAMLSNGSSEPMAGKEIVTVNLSSTKKGLNFVYGNKTNVTIWTYVGSDAIYKADNNSINNSWGEIYNGVMNISLSPSFKVKLYEEDGVTPVMNINGDPAETWVLSSDKTQYGFIGQTGMLVDHKSVYTLKVIDYDTYGYPTGASNITSPVNVQTITTSTQVGVSIHGSNTVDGTFFLNKSNTGGFVSGTDDGLLGIQVNLYRLRQGTSTWDYVAVTTTGKNGKYGFRNLPNGTYQVRAGTLGPISVGNVVTLEGDIDPETAIGTVTINLTSSNTAAKNQDIWYKTTQNSYIFKGGVYLDSYLNNGKVEKGGTNNQNDLPLPNATVLLCLDSGNSANCALGGSDYITHQVTTITGAYEFNSTNTPSLTAGTNYLIRAYRDDVTMLNNSSVSSSYQMSTPVSGYDLPIANDFLAKSNIPLLSYKGFIGNDVNGDLSITNGTESIANRGYIQYWDVPTSGWITWAQIGGFYGEFEIYNLPPGKYRHSYENLDATSRAAFIATIGSNPDNLWSIPFEVLPSGGFADGLAVHRNIYRGVVLNSDVTEAISGNIYLDITGSGIKDDSSMVVPGSALTGTSVKGFFSPRIYPSYNTDPMSLLISGTPDFEDKNVAANNGKFAYTAANKVLNPSYFLYSNYLLSLENLPAEFEIVNNSGYQKSYLPSAILGNKQYMQLDGLPSGSTGQYWLIRLKNPTEISGRLYYDLDKNSQYNSGDSPMTGTRVELWKDGQFYTYVNTDNAGKYSFVNLLSGDYEVHATSTGLDSTLYELENPVSGIIGTFNLKIGDTPYTGNDFIYKKIGDASISGNVMVDINNNGELDINFNKTGDLALENVVIELYKGTIGGTPYKTVQTNAKGYYSFSGIDLNTSYIVHMVTPVGYGVIKNANGATTNTLTAITVGATPISASNQYFLLAGASNSNPSGGNSSLTAMNSGIAGQSLLDDGNNTPFVGVTVGLVNSANVEIARQITDNNGNYHFYNLPSDTYSIHVISAPAGYVLIKNSEGTTAPLDVLPSIALTTTGTTGKSFWYKSASPEGIKGNVYVDFADTTTNTTTLDSHTHLIDDSVTVNLYDGLNATGTLLSTTTTTNGAYQFPNLLYGSSVNYSVKIIMSSVTNYNFKLSKGGNTSSDVVINITGLPASGSLDNHYIVVGKLNLGGDVWIDSNGNLTKDNAKLTDGVTVNLNYKAPGSTTFTLLKSITTGTTPATTGRYGFAKLPIGTDYQIVVDSTSSALAGTTLIPATGIGSIANNSNTYTLTALAADSLDQSTAYNYNGKINGQLFIDVDSNNVATTGVDTPFAGVELDLTATINGTVVTKTVTTDVDGKFSVTNLPIGNWSLNAKATQTLANWSSYTLGFVKNAAGTTTTGSRALPLTMAISATDITFNDIVVGYQGTAKISGYVVIDTDPSSTKTVAAATDTPLSGVTVTLSSSTTGFVSRTITTNTAGYYEFTTLAPHTYNVAVDTTNTQLAGHIVSFDPIGTTLSSVGITVTAADSNLTTKDFGFKSNGGLSGYIYRDISGTGSRNAALDDKLAGVRVKATQGSVVRYSNVTTADGGYAIDNLATGLWTVELDTLPSTDYSYSYQSDTFGVTATVVTNGAEIDISPIAPKVAVKGATLSFGLRANASISGKVVIDVDDAVPSPANVDSADINVDTLYPTYKATLYVGNTVVASSVVTAGEYRFTRLSSGVAYRVDVARPSADYTDSFNAVSPVNSGTVESTAALMSQTYTLTATNTAVTDANFGWKGVGSIAGDIFWDKNDNGIYNAGIDSSVNTPLTLTFTQTGLPVITRTIAATDTAYLVTGMIPGSWLIEVNGVPSTFKASFDPNSPHSVSQLASNPNKATIMVGATALTAQNFGYIKGGAMTGAIKNDTMSTGIYDENSPGVGGVEVALLDSSGNPLMDITSTTMTTKSDSSGKFSFRNLDPQQDYKLRVVFGSATSSLLTDMEPSYDSEVGSINLASPPVTVDVLNEQHTIDALISKATNDELTATDLHFGYRSAGGDLTIHKVALKDNVVVGDFVPYRITIENNLATPALNMVIRDLIPAGFKYVNGSARLDGVEIANPVGGRPIEFRNLDFGGNTGSGTTPSKRTLTYLLVVGAGVTQGEYVNKAVAVTRNAENASNISEATVTVTADPLFDNSLILGKVYIDRNGNGIQDEGEEGLGGVKLVTARGEIITTDQYGRYHLAGVEGGRWERGTNFVLKLDVWSLPAGYELIGRNPVVVRLSPGLPSKIDFKVREGK